jgi:hypothetical protein
LEKGSLGRLPAIFCSLLILVFFSTPSFAADANFSRFCASCGFTASDTFASSSRQFIVHGVGRAGLYRAPRGTNATTYITAEPQLVAMMGDRVSRALAQELRWPAVYRDNVHISVFHNAPADQLIGLITQVHTDSFQYKMSVPGQVESEKLLKALVQVSMQEFANRGGNRAGEMPNWIVEGILRQVQTRVVPAFVVNRKPITIERSGLDRLGESRAYFQTNTPMTLNDLSFADLTKVTPEQREQFEASAHLLVHQLLRLKEGPVLMSRFLQTLPQTLNWQTAFYSVYKTHFSGPLEFEKWWMLNWVRFKNTDDREAWPVALTLERLESVLLTAMEVRVDANSIPKFRETTLQEFLQLADFSTQKELLGQKLQQLSFMSVSSAPQATPLLSAYQQALESYLQKRGNDTQPTLKSDPAQRLQALLRTTLKTFDDLDLARAELKAGRTPVLPQEPTRQQASR